MRILLGPFRLSLWRRIYTCYKFYTLHRECFVRNTVFSEFFLTRQTDTKLAEVQFSPRYWNGRRSLRSLPLHSLTRNPPFTAGGLSSKVINSGQWIIVQLWNGGKFGGVLLHDIREKFKCYVSKCSPSHDRTTNFLATSSSSSRWSMADIINESPQ